jgi:methylenetetrahydrofolate reductase (NADPH)
MDKSGVGVEISPPVSVEVFPPRTPEGLARLRAACERLAPLRPAHVSVTCPPGGDARTYETVKALRGCLDAAIRITPHLVCVGSTRQSVRERLAAYAALGIDHFVVIRGDRSPDAGGPPGDFPHASDLVAFIRAQGHTRLHIDVAAHPEVHPEAPSARADLAAFRTKIEAGADGAITQYFYNPDAYREFVDSCRRLGLTVPIVPGIMPITQHERLMRFSDMAGVDIPRWLRKRLEDVAGDPAALRAFGLDVVSALCARLLDQGVPRLHFYTMNDPEPTRAICARLGLFADPGVRSGCQDQLDCHRLR